MATFKIRDLMVTLEPGGRGATAQERHRTLAQACAELPTGPGAAGYFACGASPEPDFMIGANPTGAAEGATAQERLLLKKQLQDLLAQVEPRETELGTGTGTPSSEPTGKDLKGWESGLSKALARVRSMIAKRAKAASKGAKKKGAKKKSAKKKSAKKAGSKSTGRSKT
jgi:hypothetical protein